jgi:tetratricopeptide (TPR) repeat protein
MRIKGQIAFLLLAFICMPSHLSAQSQPSAGVVSLRELSIPSKALRAFEQGMECMAKQDAAGSLPHFQRAIAEFAGYYEAYDRMGAADLKLWRLADAEQAFREAIELSGGQYAHPLVALGAILNANKQFAEAEAVTRKGLRLAPDSWTGQYYLALALFGLNRLEDAENSVRVSLRLKPEFAEAHLLLADIHSRQSDYRALVDDLDEYLKVAPDNPSTARIKALRESAQAMLARFQSSNALVQTQP